MEYYHHFLRTVPNRAIIGRSLPPIQCAAVNTNVSDISDPPHLNSNLYSLLNWPNATFLAKQKLNKLQVFYAVHQNKHFFTRMCFILKIPQAYVMVRSIPYLQHLRELRALIIDFTTLTRPFMTARCNGVTPLWLKTEPAGLPPFLISPLFYICSFH